MDLARLNSFQWHNAQSLTAHMKILIIDDQPSNVALLEDLLSSSGYTDVKSITDPRLAIDTYSAFKPDIILLDLMMPYLDGFAVLDLIRAYSTEMFLPILVLTADVTDQSKRRALDGGATDFLHKPFDPIEVLLRIRNLLTTRWMHVQLVRNYVDALWMIPTGSENALATGSP